MSEDTIALRTARKLRKSSRRRIWRTLLSLSDWPTYVWVCLVIWLAASVPISIYRLNKRAQQHRMVLAGIAEMSPNYRKILDLLDHGPAPRLQGMPFVDVGSLGEPDVSGFEVLSDTRIFDLRGWSDPTGNTPATSYARLRVRRTREGGENTHVRLQRVTVDEDMPIVCAMQSLNPSLSRMRSEDGSYIWELDLDFSHVPIGGHAEVSLQCSLSSEMAGAVADQGRFDFTVRSPTGLLQVWILLPEGRDYSSFEVSSYPIGRPEAAQIVVPHSATRLALGSIATFRLVNPDAGRCYECRWQWRREAETR